MWILPFLGDMPLRTLTPAAVRRWHAEVAASTGSTATRQAYALLRAILNTAVADDAIGRNPCRIRGAGQPHTPERPLIDPTDVERAAAAMPAGLEATVLLALWAHLRIGEVLGLQRGDIDLDAGTLSVHRQVVEVRNRGPVVVEPKMGSRRVVHLPDPAVDAIRWPPRRDGADAPDSPPLPPTRRQRAASHASGVVLAKGSQGRRH